ncbi:hypothetical protein BJ508DRAFT_333606 [Ascobolus immersus RN42]|uniref:Uncharacterized protein n=1 Tax=Ascobolus immersus RN42 TaxID=1160509 RepID=A0A3N4HQ43_ASCIM|nr:hypothetical protein BJ508DRAFT_333606 [Ascobolus immersus RN42]
MRPIYNAYEEYKFGNYILQVIRSAGPFPVLSCPMDTCKYSSNPPTFARKNDLYSHLLECHVWLCNLQGQLSIFLKDSMSKSLKEGSARIFVVEGDRQKSNTLVPSLEHPPGRVERDSENYCVANNSVDEDLNFDSDSDTASVASDRDYDARESESDARSVRSDTLVALPDINEAVRRPCSGGNARSCEELEESMKEIQTIMRKRIPALMDITMWREAKEGPLQPVEAGCSRCELFIKQMNDYWAMYARGEHDLHRLLKPGE